MLTRFLTSASMHAIGIVLGAICTVLCVCAERVLADPPAELTNEQVTSYLEQIQRDGNGTSISNEHANALVQKLRIEFAYQSLRDRLAYENKGSKTSFRVTSQPISANKRPVISAVQTASSSSAEEQFRAKSLELLHQMEVRKFVDRNDFGIMRVRPPGPIYLRLENKPVPFDIAPDWNEIGYGTIIEDLPSRVQELRMDDYVDRPFDAADKNEWIARHRRELRHSNPKRLPSRDFLLELHGNAQSQFLSPKRLGHVVSIDRVAGFMGHGINRRIPADAWDTRNQYTLEEFFDHELLRQRQAIQQTQPADAVWLVKSMQLISLLKHNQPVSYESVHLPNMSELIKAKTRSLNEFESSALEQLKRDRNVVIECRENRIQMVGSIRATENCLQCHQVENDSLLGAFTYVLERNRDSSLDTYREAAAKWLPDVEKLAKDNATAGASETIVCIGSSSFRTWDSIDVDMAPIRVVRRAFGGSKYSDVAIHIDQLIADLEFRAAMIYVGNDIVGKEDDRTPAEVSRLAEKVIDGIRRERPSAAVFLIALSPAPSRFDAWEKIQQANEQLKLLAAKTPNTYYISTAKQLLDSNNKPREELFKEDRLHLNARGYEVWSSILKSEIATHLP